MSYFLKAKKLDIKTGQQVIALFDEEEAFHFGIRPGDKVEIIGPAYNKAIMSVKTMRDLDTGQKLTEAHGGGGNQEILIHTKTAWPEFSVLRRFIK